MTSNSQDSDDSEAERGETQRHRIGLTASQVAASALAASCAAIVASYLGVAGTISGAAIGSIVATTGSAFYGHAFHTGGKKIVKRLGPNGFPMSELRLRALNTARAETNRATGLKSMVRSARTGLAELKQGFGYRKAAALAAALLVVFGAAITVGLLAGGPVRQAGAGINFKPTHTVTRQPTATRTAGASGSSSPSATPTATTDPSASASVSSSGSADATTSSAGSGAASPPGVSQTGPSTP